MRVDVNTAELKKPVSMEDFEKLDDVIFDCVILGLLIRC